jgi:6-phosphogluconolactonase (cycloisomerase 2 family)
LLPLGQVPKYGAPHLPRTADHQNPHALSFLSGPQWRHRSLIGMYRIAVASHTHDAGRVIRLDADEIGGPWRVTGESPALTGAQALVAHPSGRCVYLADGVGDQIASVGVDALTGLGRQASGGTLPCAMAVHPSGRFLVTAHYLGRATLAVHPIGADQALGPLVATLDHHGGGPVAERQEAAHLHHVSVDPQRGTAVVTDLGSDRLYEYEFGPDGRPALVDEVAAPAGSGPRHSRFAPDGDLLVSDELSSALSRYRRDPRTGRLTWVEAADTRDGAGGPANFPSEVVLGPGVAYVGNRGRDTIAVIDVAGPALTRVQEAPAGGAFPQHLAVLDEHLLCANRESNTITALGIGPDGRLGPPAVVAEVPGPNWITVI